MLGVKMLILAIDTSHKNGSVCLARGDGSAFELIGSAEVDGGMFSAQLVPVIARLLAQHKFTKNDLQAIAAAVGPGSFTGLRIGLAAVKGFAEVLHIPIARVPTLEAVAAIAGSQRDRVLAVLDAGRKEFYVGEYAEGQCVSEKLLTREEFLTRLTHDRCVVVSPDAAVSEIAQAAGAPFESVQYPDALIIARLGLEKVAAGLTTGVDEFDANYVRRDEGLFSSGK